MSANFRNLTAPMSRFFGGRKASTSRKGKNRATKSRAGRSLQIEGMENRELFSVSSLWFSGNMLVVKTDNASTSVSVNQSGSNVRVAEVGTARYWDYQSSSVGSIEFQGGNGNDRFVSYIPSLSIRAFGGSGNDYLEGYNGNDIYVGGDGNDTLVGYGGNDSMWGGAGNDVLRGMAGNDRLMGDADHDVLEGGDGNDSMWGGNGNDLLRGGNGHDYMLGETGNDYVDGSAGNDTMWGGANNDILLGGDGNDQLIGDAGNDRLNGQAGIDSLWGGSGRDVLISIDAAFGEYVDAGNDSDADTMWVDRVGSSRDRAFNVKSGDALQEVASFANGADRTLNGDNIADPTDTGNKLRYTNNITAGNTKGSNPLFSDSGPRADDVTQGALGDCWLLAGLAAIGIDNPQALRHNVVDFDDGTYGVKLGGRYYRVDNELPVYNTSGSANANNLRFASLGAENSTWVAVVEKAFAHYRTGANRYSSIEGGWGVEVNRAFGSSSAGEKSIRSYSNATSLANDIANRWNGYQAVTIGFLSRNGNVPIIAQHMYTVAGVNYNIAGQVVSIVLRNPHGANTGQFTTYVTLTPAQLYAQTGAVNWGRV